MKTCASCGTELKGLMISCRDGWNCERCHYIQNPFKAYETFREVINGDDQVLMRELLVKYVPDSVKLQVIRAFNAVMLKKYDQRCLQLRITDEERANQDAKQGQSNH